MTDTIEVEEGQTLLLEFKAFDIHTIGSGDCIFDHLTITDGDGTTLMGESCGPSTNGIHPGGGIYVVGGENIGSSLPAAIKSQSNLVNIKFWTDGYDYGNAGTRTGWSIKWSVVTPGQSHNKEGSLKI